MKRYKPYFNEDITIDFIPILNKVVKSYISKNRDNNFFTGDCANFAEALFKFIQYNEIIHNLKEDKDYYIVTMSDNSVSHTVLFIKGKYIDASGINTKNQIKDKFATGDGKVVWEKDEGIYNNSGVSSTKILNGLENEFEKFYPDLSSKLSEDIAIPLSKGDTFFYGKFKNKQAIYASDYINDKGDPIIVTDTGKEIPMCKIRLMTEKKFSENLRFTDLMKKASISPFTMDYSKETNRLMGAPTTHTKLRGIRVNKKKDYVIFIWKTKRTPKYDNKKQPMKAVDPKDEFKMKNANFYTIEIKVLDFFKLLKTKPDNNFTNKDIEEVFAVADIQVWSSVPAYQYQGMNYNMSLFDASIYPELRAPKIWNDIVSQYGKTHNEYQFLDKHTAGVINSIKFFYPIMRQMIKKYLDK